MKTFRTAVSIKPGNSLISLKTPVLTAGSCFADAIGLRLTANKFPVMVNPFGTSYNPYSIHKSLLYAITNELPPDNTFTQNQDIYLNYDFHSEVSASEKKVVQQKLADIIGTTHYFLKSCKWVMITYGTAWIYERRDTGEIVSNCHKQPASTFSKRLMSEKEIIESFDTFYNTITTFNPDIKIIVTVSPVRHLKDTLELNSVSKSIIRTACHSVTTSYENVEYFPAYEVMMDDLRDYRFYKSDMIHPTRDAEDYIFELFGDRYFDSNTRLFIKEWSSIMAALQHKPFHPSSPAHQRFLTDTLKRLEALRETIDIEKEAEKIKAQLL